MSSWFEIVAHNLLFVALTKFMFIFRQIPSIRFAMRCGFIVLITAESGPRGVHSHDGGGRSSLVFN